MCWLSTTLSDRRQIRTTIAHCASSELRFASLQCPEQCRTAYLRHEGFTAEEYNARSGLLRMRKDLREIQIVR
jgi:hypothetical protein